ncbi:MAG: heparinase II/III family protein [Clostridia bacterium]|nr:heparinase II/III family protein [Clostridia bacterium]
MFEAYLDYKQLSSHLTLVQIFHPATDRTYWNRLRDDFGAEIQEEIAYYDRYNFPVLRASWYREFETKNDRAHFENEYFHRRAALVAYTMAEAMFDDGRYLEQIMDLAWMIMEETEWAVPTHVRERPRSDSLTDHRDTTLDLFAAETGTTLAFTYAVLHEKLDTLSRNIARRIEEMVYDRILDNYLHHDEYWYLGMSGRVVNNWNPWINSNVLIATAVFAPNDRLRADLVRKVMVTLDNYLRHYPEDGACDEGPSYWMRAGASAIECAELLRAMTGGWANILPQPKMVQMARFILNVRIYGDRVMNFSDCASHSSLEPGLLMYIGKVMGEETLCALAKVSFDGYKPNIRRNYNTMRVLYLAENIGELRRMDARMDYVREKYWASTQWLMVREQTGSDRGLYLAAKGGHNRESHNHNDIGSFMVYKDGAPFLVDSGPMAYNALTFGEFTRYTLWVNISEYHNLPTINGINQHDGREYRARNVQYASDDRMTCFSLDIAGAYEAQAGVQQWMRTIGLDKTTSVIRVTEEYRLERAESVVLNFMSAAEVTQTADGLELAADNGAKMRMDVDLSRFEVAVEAIDLSDRVQKASWDKLFRVRLTLKQPEVTGKIEYSIY